jgi:hypothetical protein
MVINYLINYIVADFGLGLPCATPTPSPVITLPVLDFLLVAGRKGLLRKIYDPFPSFILHTFAE